MPDPVAVHSLMEHSLGELVAAIGTGLGGGAGGLWLVQWLRGKAPETIQPTEPPDGWAKHLDDLADTRARVQHIESKVADLHAALPTRADLVAIGEERANSAAHNQRIAQALEALSSRKE